MAGVRVVPVAQRTYFEALTLLKVVKCGAANADSAVVNFQAILSFGQNQALSVGEREPGEAAQTAAGGGVESFAVFVG